MTNADQYRWMLCHPQWTNYGEDFVKKMVLPTDGMRCTGLSGHQCHAVVALFLQETCGEGPIDWSKVAVDTPVLVSDTETDGWYRRHFAAYKDGMVYAWKNGCTSFTSTVFVPWAHANLVREEKR